MAETENAVACKNVNPSAFCVKDIVGEKDTHSRETMAGHYDEKFRKKLLSALDLANSDTETTSEDEMEMTSEDEMEMICFGDDDFAMDYMDLLRAAQKRDIVGKGDTAGHDHNKCINEQLTALKIEDSEQDITSEDEMDSRGWMCLCGPNHFKYAEFMRQIEMKEILEKYSISRPKPKIPTPEEWDVLLTKKEREGFDMSLEDLLCSKYPLKEEDLDYALVWSDTDE